MPRFTLRDEFVRGELIKLKARTYCYYPPTDQYLNFGGKFASFHRWLPDGNCVVTCQYKGFVINPNQIMGYVPTSKPQQQQLF